MTTLWQRLYHPATTPESIISTLKNWFTAEKYTAYDPFPGGMGAPIRHKDRVKLFVAPSHEGWVQVLVEPNHALPDGALAILPPPSINIEILTDTPPQLSVLGGELSQFLRDPQLQATLEKALAVTAHASSTTKETDILDQVAQAHGMKSNFLMRQMAKQYLKKASKEAGEDPKTIEAQAKQALAQVGEVDWGREDVLALRDAISQLTLPTEWHWPNWKQLQIAYSLTRPTRGLTIAGDQEAQRAIPNAADYTPLFYAR